MKKNSIDRRPAPNDDYGLVQACRRLHTAIDEMDEKTARLLEVSRNDLRCLNLLEHGPVTPKSLAQSLNLTSGSITSLLDRLEAKGFIHRLSHPEDRRALLVELKPAAFRKLGSIYRKCGEAVVALSEEYGASKSTEVAMHLGQFSKVFETVASSLVTTQK